MHGRMKSTSTVAITASAIAVSVFAFAPHSVAAPAADNCLAAPNAQAPAGSHWFYKLDRGTQRKCWRLVKKDEKARVAARTAPQPPQGDDDADDDAPATTASAPIADKPPVKVTTSSVLAPRNAQPAPPPAASEARDLMTRNASNTEDFVTSAGTTPASAATDTDVPSASAAPADPAVVPAPAATAAPAPVVAQPTVQRAAATDAVEAAPEATSMPTLKLLLLAIALTGLFAGGIYLVMEMLRRRTDVLTRVHDDERSEMAPDEMPYEESPETAFTHQPPRQGRMKAEIKERPTFEPLPAMGQVGSEPDSIEEALRRMHGRRRRPAAA